MFFGANETRVRLYVPHTISLYFKAFASPSRFRCMHRNFTQVSFYKSVNFRDSTPLLMFLSSFSCDTFGSVRPVISRTRSFFNKRFPFGFGITFYATTEITFVEAIFFFIKKTRCDFVGVAGEFS